MKSEINLEIVQKPKLYVGCALTEAPQAFIDEVERLKEALEVDWHILKFLGLTDGTDGDVYNQDININVRGCDAFIGVVDYGATGLGWEAGVADDRDKPMLVVKQIDKHISRLPKGAPDWRPNITFRTYENMVEDVPEIARIVFSNILAA